MFRRLLFTFVLLAAIPLQASSFEGRATRAAFEGRVTRAAFEGRVTRVKDGDSLLVFRPDVKRTSEIRLAGIDAPEYSQPWGIQSRSALRLLVNGKQVRVEVTDRDRYNRVVARVWVGKTYVNAWMTEQGHAWAFDRYMKDSHIRAGQDAACGNCRRRTGFHLRHGAR